MKGITWHSSDIQTIFNAPRLKYFPVTVQQTLNKPDIDRFLDSQLAAANLKDQEETRQNNMIVPEDLTGQNLSPWLNQTGWLDLLFNQDMNELYAKTNAHVDDDDSFTHV